MNEIENDALLAAVHEAIHTVNDPEFGIPVDDLGLIYDITVRGDQVSIAMTLTSEHCPAGEVIVGAVTAAAERVPGVREATVAVVWDPVWTPDMIVPSAREMLGWV